MKNKILILYKNNKIKKIKKSNWKDIVYDDKNIEYILIPYLGFKNVYIPIKSNSVYNNFNKAKISILYSTFHNDIYKSKYLQEKLPKYYKYGDDLSYVQECLNIVEYINALYNILKYINVTNAINDDKDKWIIYPIELNISIFNQYNEIIEYRNKEFESIDIMPNIDIKLDSKIYKKVKKYLNNIFLNDNFYIPTMINIDNDNWEYVKRIKNLNNDSILLTFLDDFGVYYMITFESYNKLLKFDEFKLSIISVESILPYENNYMKSMDSNKRPSIDEKIELLDCYNNEEVDSGFVLKINIKNIYDFLQYMIFLEPIMHIIHYIIKLIYGDSYVNIYNSTFEDTKLKIIIFSLLESIDSIPLEEPNKLLFMCENELSYKNILNSFSYMINK